MLGFTASRCAIQNRNQSNLGREVVSSSELACRISLSRYVDATLGRVKMAALEKVMIELFDKLVSFLSANLLLESQVLLRPWFQLLRSFSSCAEISALVRVP